MECKELAIQIIEDIRAVPKDQVDADRGRDPEADAGSVQKLLDLIQRAAKQIAAQIGASQMPV